MIQYPKWLYHKTLAHKIVHTKEEHDAQGSEWKETPAAFAEEQVETAKKQTPYQAEGEQGQKDIQEADFTKMKVAQLKEFLISKGLSEDELDGLKKDELIAKVGAL